MAINLTTEHVNDLVNRMAWYITNPDNSVLKPGRAPSFIQMVAREIACRISPEPTEPMLYDLVGKSLYHCKDKLGKASHNVSNEAVYVATIGFTTVGEFPPEEPSDFVKNQYATEREAFRQAQIAKKQAKQGQATAHPEPEPTPTPEPTPEPTVDPQAEPGVNEPSPTVQEPAVEPTPEPQCELSASA